MRVLLLGLLGTALALFSPSGGVPFCIADDAETTELLLAAASDKQRGTSEPDIDTLTFSISEAPEIFFSEFISGAARRHYPTDFAYAAIRDLGSVRAKRNTENDHGAIYKINSNTLFVPSHWLDPDGKLLPFAKLHGDDSGSIFHELWHVYFHRRLKNDASFMAQFDYSARKHFPNLGTKNRQEALEEAYGLLISNVISHFWTLERHAPARTEQERLELCRKLKLPALKTKYQESFSAYYSNYFGKSVFAGDVRLETGEIEWIQSVLFENKLRY